MDLRRFAFIAGALTVSLSLPAPATADVLSDLADQCSAALLAGDDASFQAAADAIRDQKNVFNTVAIKQAEKCLSEGFGEPWEYWFPDSEFVSSAEVFSRVAAQDEAKQQKREAAVAAWAAAELNEANRKANAARVAQLVYRSCGTLLADDEVAAMTNEICVESFLTNGLPAPTTP